VLSSACWAQHEPQATESDWIARDFTFATGEKLSELRLQLHHARQPQRDAAGHVRNAVLILHGTGSSSQPFLTGGFLGALFLSGQPLDAESISSFFRTDRPR